MCVIPFFSFQIDYNVSSFRIRDHVVSDREDAMGMAFKQYIDALAVSRGSASKKIIIPREWRKKFSSSYLQEHNQSRDDSNNFHSLWFP